MTDDRPPTEPQLTSRLQRPGPRRGRTALPPRPQLRRAPPARRERPTLAWLWSKTFPPLPLGHSPTLNIGRHPESDLVLQHKEVSRRHGAIKTRGQLLVYADNGSSNGSFINGSRVTAPSTLKIGDRLAIGAYVFRIRSQEELSEAKADDSATRAHALVRRVQGQPRAALSGSIADMSLAEVLQSLEFNAKTGELKVKGKSVSGRVAIREGRPLVATLGGLSGAEAVMGMFQLSEGSFTLSAEPPNETKDTIRKTFTQLLFEVSRLRDEGPLDHETARFEADR